MNTTIFHHYVTSVTVTDAEPVGDNGNVCRSIDIITEDGGRLCLHLFSKTAEATLPVFEIEVTEAA